MTSVEKHITEVYSEILGNLSPKSKMKLIENLSNSLNSKRKNKETTFYKSFGAFASDKSAEDIIKEIREARAFRKKEISF